MKDRIRKLMEGQHMQQSTFADFVGISASTLSFILNGRTKPTMDTVFAIKGKFPKLRTDWLLYGTGQMFDDEKGASESSATPSTPTPQGSTLSPNAEQDLFSQPERRVAGVGVQTTLKSYAPESVKYIDKPQRKITEIRIFYDDQTWETFVPKK